MEQKSSKNAKDKIVLITTGGTIDKTYDELTGILENTESAIKKVILEQLRLPYTSLDVVSIFSKDSLFLNDDDRLFLSLSIKHHLNKKLPIVVLHGTDTMAVSAEYCFNNLGNVPVPIVFTGAMRPLEFDGTDAKQNVTEALLAAKLLPPGVYISFHNRIFNVPGVQKNRDKKTFEYID